MKRLLLSDMIKNCLVFVSLLSLTSYVCQNGNGDLPIHALLSDIKGEWQFHLSHLNNSVSLCGSSLPNRNSQNMKPELQNYKDFLEEHYGGIETTLQLQLSDSATTPNQKTFVATQPQRLKWQSLAVFDASKQLVGHWTPVYDEAFQVTVGTNRLVAFLKYSLKPSCTGALDGDSEEPNGSTECYVTDPSQTLVGWFTQYNPMTGQTQFGCFYGSKVAPSALLETKSVVALHNKFPKEKLRMHTYFTSEEFVTGHNQLQNSLWKATQYNDFKGMNAESLAKFFKDASLKQIWRSPSEGAELASLLEISQTARLLDTSSRHGCSCEAGKTTGEKSILAENEKMQVKPHDFQDANTRLPTSFTWGDPFSDGDTVFDKKSIPTPLNQGSCGSCYAIAFAYVLQHRFNIAAQKLANGEKDLFATSPLSPQSILSCSFYNQGCDGGYPFLAAVHAKDVGIPDSRCMEYQGNHDIPCRFLQNNPHSATSTVECADSHRWYAKDYGYVGGCYECGGCNAEENMMREIYHGGPIVAAFDAAKELLAYYNGIFDSERPDHSRICDDPTGANGTLAGWEFTNHAVSIVGWGEDADSGESKKYWVVRNTWGNNWGQSGYFKVVRGKNLGGIENQAVWVDPDFTRGGGYAVAQKQGQASFKIQKEGLYHTSSY